MRARKGPSKHRLWKARANSVKGLSPSQKAVLKELADHADWDDGTCYPSNGTLATNLSCSQKTVSRALNVLEDRKLIRRYRMRQANGRHGSYRFALTLPAAGVSNGLCDAASGHSGPHRPDTESGLNSNTNFHKNALIISAREFEDELIAAMRTRWCPERHPQTLSLWCISKDLEALSGGELEMRISELLSMATEHARRLEREHKHLRDWRVLLRPPSAASKPSIQTSGSSSHIIESDGSLRGALADLMMSSGMPVHIAERELKDVDFIESGDAVTLRADVGCTFSRLSDKYAGQISEFAVQIGHPVQLVAKGQRRRTFMP